MSHTSSPHKRRPAASRRAIALAAATLSGCMGMPPPVLPPRADVETTVPAGAASAPAVSEPASAAASATAAASSASAPRSNAPSAGTAAESSDRLFQTPQPPRPRRNATPLTPPSPGAPDDQLTTAVSLEQMPLPVFVNTVYGTILKRNVSMDQAVADRKELVSLKTGKAQTATGLYEAARAVLKSYGIAVTDINGLVRVTPATGTAGYMPELLRGRSLPEVPAALRPVFYLYELESVSPSAVTSWLKTMFGSRIQAQDDLGRQAIMLSGQWDDILAARDAIEVLDQPMMRGRISARVLPLFWSADELAKRLSDVLTSEGYAVGTAANAQAPVILLPVGPLNSVIVFASSQAVLNHTLRWATELDQPASGRGTAGYFTYAVRNIDAADLAKTLQEVMNPAGTTTGGSNSAAASGVRSRVVVNPSTNTLIIQGSPTEYQQWFGLLQELDRPPRTALVSVTVAEVGLTHSQQLGFEWMLNQFKVNGYNVNVSTLGAFGTSAIGGLAATINSATSSARALLNTLASTTRVRVLANPSVMARNGEAAFIQVGSEVPVVTSQQSTGTTTVTPGGSTQTGLLQTIQYRSTGVILRVKPVIHSGGRIDLDVEQEVSSAASTRTGVSASPTISTRKITTKLSVTDGATVLLGGLMQETATNADTGVPIAKDIPILGHLFKSSDDSRDRTELVVLITPYIVSDEFEAHAISEAFRKQFSWDATTPGQALRPPNASAGAKPSEIPNDPRARAVESRPYVLPPADAALPAEPAAVRSPDNLQRRAPINGVPSSDTPIRNPSVPQQPASSAAPASPGAPRSTSGSQPVTDPQILKELNDALKNRR